MIYDIIGDVHGEYQLLKKALLDLGYEKNGSTFSHPGRKVIFTGDFINRGPEIRKTVKTIRTMVEKGHALAILGNHEVNAIIYHMKDKDNTPLMKEPRKNYLSLYKTLNEYLPYADELADHLNWFRTLPLFLEIENFRVVHACWSNRAVDIIKQEIGTEKLRKKILRLYHKKPKSDIGHSIRVLTRGVDYEVPDDLKIYNNKGDSVRSFRLAWWKDPEGETFRDMNFESKYELPAYTIPQEIAPSTHFYAENEPIVFFGHYCRAFGPHIISHNVCCVDSCVTGTKTLSVYSWKGEDVLNSSHLKHYKLEGVPVYN